MKCKSFNFSAHSVKRMFERDISIEDVKKVITSGEVIKEYPNDKPYPSVLILGKSSGKIIHVVLAMDENGACIVITVYEPKSDMWNDDFKTKK